RCVIFGKNLARAVDRQIGFLDARDTHLTDREYRHFFPPVCAGASSIGAALDRIEALDGVVAGLVPATRNLRYRGSIIEVAGTSPATTQRRAEGAKTTRGFRPGRPSTPPLSPLSKGGPRGSGAITVPTILTVFPSAQYTTNPTACIT